MRRIIYSGLIMSYFVVFLLLAASIDVKAQEKNPIEEIINYQGRIMDVDGMPVDNDTYTILFSLYESPNSITPVWSEIQNVTTKYGFFNVYLGKENKFSDSSIKFDRTYYIGFTFPGMEEFNPRTKLAVSPYAFTAKKLEYPYVDTIYVGDGIALTMKAKGTALNINKTNGKAIVITNTGEKSSAPAVSINDSTNGTALKVIADGFRGKAAYFSTSNTSARTPTAEIYNHGRGSALYITNTNSADTMPVVQIFNKSMGYSMLIQSYSEFLNKSALMIDAFGIGGGALFRIFNKENIESPLITQTYGLGTGAEIHSFNKNNRNTALLVSTYAKGPAANFSILDKNNDTTGLYVETQGKGDAAKIFINNSENTNHALRLSSNGTGSVLYSKAENKTSAALFENNDSSDVATLETYSKSDAPAIFATNTKGKTVAEFSISNMNATSGPVVNIEHKGGGRALSLHSTSGPLYPALYVKKDGISAIAAIFTGSVTVNGELKKMSGSFVIDHPLDPANKLLSHSFVESPDMKNLYDGIVTLDKNGEAEVILPDWFEALNKDFRYQLTCIGGWAQVYIAQEIKNNRFKIAGGKPGMKISWMVTGTRHDPWANENRIQVESEKSPQNKGTYMFEDYYNKHKK